MELALEFESTKFEVVDHNGKPWIQARQLGEALGYSRPDAVLNIYDRNKDEFTPDMTTTIELMVGVASQKVRIFSLRGCHLLSMFARTPIAKAFRKWVLDVLDQMARKENQSLVNSETGAPDAPITPADQNTLQAIVRAKVAQMPETSNRGGFPQIWSRFNNHFRLGSYKQLPQSKMAEAVAYLVAMDVKPDNAPTQKELPPSGDKYLAYIEEVETFRQNTIKGIDRLIHNGLKLMDVYKFGPEPMTQYNEILIRWLMDVVVHPSALFDSGWRDSEYAIRHSPIGLVRELEKRLPDMRK